MSPKKRSNDLERSKFRQKVQSFVCVPPWRRVTFKFWEMLKNASEVNLSTKKIFLNFVQRFVESEVSLADSNSNLCLNVWFDIPSPIDLWLFYFMLVASFKINALRIKANTRGLHSNANESLISRSRLQVFVFIQQRNWRWPISFTLIIAGGQLRIPEFFADDWDYAWKIGMENTRASVLLKERQKKKKNSYLRTGK
jgi:hypothetical protein